MCRQHGRGKLTITGELAEESERQGCDELPVTVEDGAAAGALPRDQAVVVLIDRGGLLP